MLVINHDLFAVDIFLQRIQALLGTEAVIGLAPLHQLLRVFHIDSGLLAFTLDIGAVAAVLIRTLVMDQSRFFQRPVNDPFRALHLALLIRILDPKKEIAVLMLGDQIRVQRGS